MHVLFFRFVMALMANCQENKNSLHVQVINIKQDNHSKTTEQVANSFEEFIYIGFNLAEIPLVIIIQ